MSINSVSSAVTAPVNIFMAGLGRSWVLREQVLLIRPQSRKVFAPCFQFFVRFINFQCKILTLRVFAYKITHNKIMINGQSLTPKCLVVSSLSPNSITPYCFLPPDLAPYSWTAFAVLKPTEYYICSLL